MEDSFRVRVDKIFGSLSSSTSVPSSLSVSSSLPPPPARPLWCLTDEEVVKREWKRDRGSPETEPPPFPSSFDGYFYNQRSSHGINCENLFEEPHDVSPDLGNKHNDENDDDDPFSRRQFRQRRDNYTVDDDDWEIRSSIGLDCTLDTEEEEDVYDRVAVGDENVTDRLYMNRVNDQGAYLNFYKVLPEGSKKIVRDSSANHIDSGFELEEDAHAVTNSNFLQPTFNNAHAVEDTKLKPSEDDERLKPILKRQKTQMCAKSNKRVRFDPACKSCSENESVGLSEEAKLNMVPDYIQNPSKYKCYSLDTAGGDDETSNRQAYTSFLNLLDKSEENPKGNSFELPKSVAFAPRKKTGDSSAASSHIQGNKHCKEEAMPISIVEDYGGEDEACMMDEDDLEIGVEEGIGARKAARQYRKKDMSELDEVIP